MDTLNIIVNSIATQEGSPHSFWEITFWGLLSSLGSFLSGLAVFKLFRRDNQTDEQIRELSNQTKQLVITNKYYQDQIKLSKTLIKPNFVFLPERTFRGLQIKLKAMNTGGKAIDLRIHYVRADFGMEEHFEPIIDHREIMNICVYNKKKLKLSDDELRKLNLVFHIYFRDSAGNSYKQKAAVNAYSYPTQLYPPEELSNFEYESLDAVPIKIINE